MKEDYFPKYPIKPNAECTDQNCRNLTVFYSENPDKCRVKVKSEAEEVKKEKLAETENEWGITLEETPAAGQVA